jgi:ribosomal protein S12 methylthiotransferase
MLGDLVRHGFNVTDDHEGADAVVINTCAFVEDAKAESLEVGTWKSCKLECRV